MRKTLLTPLFAVVALAAHAQTVTVTGRVLSTTGEAQPGATVLERGTTNGTSTGPNGDFTLSVQPGATLTISAIGFATQQVAVNGRTNVEVRLTASATDLGDVVVTGSRATEGRSNILTTAPVDVISAREIKAFAQTDVSQVLTYAAPSFQSSRQSISDGTDFIDPASLRGLGPDQVLVLVNGKRRHQQSLVNINGTIGRGSVGTDLSVIPTASIKRIEVLRDGAAALYGSDAIAGVINIQLKDDSTGFQSTGYYGQTTQSDGKTEQADFNFGVGLNHRGYLDVSGQFINRGYTNRSFTDTAPLIYLGANGGNYPSSANTEQARRDLKAQDDALVAQNGFNRVDLRVGQSASRNFGGYLNGAYRIGQGYEVYVGGGASYRTGRGPGFNRLPNQPTQSDLNIFPNGFLPFINTTIYDQSAITGIRKSYGELFVDLSNTFGRNELDYNIDGTVNASLPQGPGLVTVNPTSFYAGKLAFLQNTTNLALSRKFRDLGPLATLNVAAGGEFRFDNFQIGRGEYASYINGGRLYNNAPTASGSQVFPGYQPQDEVNKSRTNVAGYLDLESDITERLLVHAAGRAERYSDFGGNISGQLAARLSLIDAIALRGAIGNGFRAPSLQQRYFTNTSTQFVSGLPNQVLTVNNDSPIVRNDFTNPTQPGFGVEPLKQEKSTNYSVGLTASAGRQFTLTVDAYQIDIRDRIVLSAQFTRTNPLVNTILGSQAVSRVQFFANAVNTRTRGIDIVANERIALGEKSRLLLTAAANFNHTQVQSFNSSSTTVNNDVTPGTSNLQNTLFDRAQRTRLESGNPRSKINLSAAYTVGIFGIEARTVRFGEISTADADPTRAYLDQTFSAKWITDLTLSAQFTKQLGLTVGVNNLFDVYPDKIYVDPRNNPNNFSVDPTTSYSSSLDNSNRGRFLYSANQFGFNGAYYFTRLNITL
ncbi:TonB-dependent receptor [Hymenobacter ginsengisoli]|uniref:TonB-dependent receptor n=1 Tax=Hymenobacter ginsengisoli TaxID=1051626 RepID=A0ABP8QT72_9BACT|nr:MULTISPECIES: TonB-dependent receptor [unclassified Hymenobacter]MBO2032155.1 TonB-dependent receptor [Hymenobacter sp. BT559]